MVSFECDYIAGAHPEILKRLEETNMESLPGYSLCKRFSARERNIPHRRRFKPPGIRFRKGMMLTCPTGSWKAY